MSKYYQSLFFVGFLLFFTWWFLTAPSQSFDKHPHTQWPANTWVLCFCLSFRCVGFLRHRIILRCCVSKAIPAWKANKSGFSIWKNFNRTLIIMATKITQNQSVFPQENSTLWDSHKTWLRLLNCIAARGALQKFPAFPDIFYIWYLNKKPMSPIEWQFKC